MTRRRAPRAPPSAVVCGCGSWAQRRAALGDRSSATAMFALGESGSEPAELARAVPGVGAAVDAELAKDGPRMALDGAEGDEEFAGDFALREAAGEQSQHVELALGEVPELAALLVAASPRGELEQPLGPLDERRRGAGVGERREQIAGLGDRAAGGGRGAAGLGGPGGRQQAV